MKQFHDHRAVAVAVRHRQTKFRNRGDGINAWETERKYFGNDLPAAEAQKIEWETNPCDGFCYSYVGMDKECWGKVFPG